MSEPPAPIATSSGIASGSAIASDSVDGFRLVDVPGFLVGRRDSIQRLIHAPWTLGLGAALVATAALAREYDAVSWLHQPQDLLGPFAASLILCAILFVFIRVCLAFGKRLPKRDMHSDTDSFVYWRDFLVVLSGYWMTAPLAWLYAFPVEIVADEETALRFNLTMLSTVSIWRVALFARFLSIRYAVSAWVTLLWVLVPCMVIAFVALFSAMMSMVSIMGGLRLTKTQLILQTYQGNLLSLITTAFLPVLIGLLVSLVVLCRRERPAQLDARRNGVVSRAAWWLPLVVTVVLLAGAAVFQPRIYRASNVDRLLADGNVDAAIQLMAGLNPAAMPIVWDPPPHFPKGRSQKPRIVDLCESLNRLRPPAWISSRLLVQADEIVMRQHGWFQGTDQEDYLTQQLPYHDPIEVEGMLVDLKVLANVHGLDEAERPILERLIVGVEQSLVAAKQRQKELQEDEHKTDTESAAIPTAAEADHLGRSSPGGGPE